MKAPNLMTVITDLLTSASNGKAVPIPMPEPFHVHDAAGHMLIDELAIAAQWQLSGPSQACRRAWRLRYCACYAELRARLAPKGAI